MNSTIAAILLAGQAVFTGNNAHCRHIVQHSEHGIRENSFERKNKFDFFLEPDNDGAGARSREMPFADYLQDCHGSLDSLSVEDEFVNTCGISFVDGAGAGAGFTRAGAGAGESLTPYNDVLSDYVGSAGANALLPLRKVILPHHSEGLCGTCILITFGILCLVFMCRVALALSFNCMARRLDKQEKKRKRKSNNMMIKLLCCLGVVSFGYERYESYRHVISPSDCDGQVGLSGSYALVSVTTIIAGCELLFRSYRRSMILSCLSSIAERSCCLVGSIRSLKLLSLVVMSSCLCFVSAEGDGTDLSDFGIVTNTLAAATVTATATATALAALSPRKRAAKRKMNYGGGDGDSDSDNNDDSCDGSKPLTPQKPKAKRRRNQTQKPPSKSAKKTKQRKRKSNNIAVGDWKNAIEGKLSKEEKQAYDCYKRLRDMSVGDANYVRLSQQCVESLLTAMANTTSTLSFIQYFGLINKLLDSGSFESDDVKKIRATMKKLRSKRFSVGTKHGSKALSILSQCKVQDRIYNAASELIGKNGKNGKNGKKELSELDKILLKMIECFDLDNPKKFKKEFNKVRKELGKYLSTKSGKTINFGNVLNTATALIILLNYAPPSSKEWKGSDEYDKEDESNGCIILLLRSFVTCLMREDCSDESAQAPDSGAYGITILDRLWWVTSTNKSSYTKEIPEVCKKLGIDDSKLHLISSLLLASHVHYANLNGIVPTLLGAGAAVRDRVFDELEDGNISPQVNHVGCVPHPECCLNPSYLIGSYEVAEIAKFSKRVLAAYANLDSTTMIPFYTLLFEKFGGLLSMSETDLISFKQSLMHAKFANSSKGGKASGKKRTEASKLYKKLTKGNDSSESRKAALNEIEKQLSVEHRRLYESSLKSGDMIKEASKLYKKLTKGNDSSESRKAALNEIEKQLSVEHRRLYEGSLKPGDMIKEASKLYKQLTKGNKKSRESRKAALNEIEKQLSVEHRRLYEGSLDGGTTSGSMAKEAHLLYKVLKGIREREVDESDLHEQLLDEIEKDLSKEHRNLLSNWQLLKTRQEEAFMLFGEYREEGMSEDEAKVKVGEVLSKQHMVILDGGLRGLAKGRETQQKMKVGVHDPKNHLKTGVRTLEKQMLEHVSSDKDVFLVQCNFRGNFPGRFGWKKRDPKFHLCGGSTWTIATTTGKGDYRSSCQVCTKNEKDTRHTQWNVVGNKLTLKGVEIACKALLEEKNLDEVKKLLADAEH